MCVCISLSFSACNIEKLEMGLAPRFPLLASHISAQTTKITAQDIFAARISSDDGTKFFLSILKQIVFHSGQGYVRCVYFSYICVIIAFH